MNWQFEDRPAGLLTVDKMARSRDPFDDYPTLDIYARRSTSLHRQVLLSMEDAPKLKPGRPIGGAG